MPITPSIQIFEDASSVATHVALALKDAINQHPSDTPFSIALSGGSTPKQLYQTLAQPPFVNEIPWERVLFFFGDERAVPHDDERSNARMADETLLQYIPSKVFRMDAEHGKDEEYAQHLRQHLPLNRQGFPVFDVVLLGIGEDGHTASLFPDTTALKEHTHAVIMNEVPQLQTRRMTLTYPTLNAAKQLWLLACGEGKQQILQQCLKADSPFPISQLQPAKDAFVWWLDRSTQQSLGATQTTPKTS